MAKGQSFEVQFAPGSLWLNAAADEVAGRFAAMSDNLPDSVVIQSTCRLQADQKLEDDRAVAVFVAIRRGGVPAESISDRSCDSTVFPAVPPGSVRVTSIWLGESSALKEAVSALIGNWRKSSGEECHYPNYRFRHVGDQLIWEALKGGVWDRQAGGTPVLRRANRVHIAASANPTFDSSWDFEIRGSTLVVWDLASQLQICQYDRAT
jgi:hypothetical protein